MKANKDFYNTLREEVWKEDLSEPVQTVLQIEDDELNRLKDKVKGLQSQIEMLEKRNLELTEKNKELEAEMQPLYFNDNHVLLVAETNVCDDCFAAMDNEQAAQYRRGYIALSDIIKWANEGTTNIEEARLIKDMIHNVMPIMTEEERSTVNSIGYIFREANVAIPQTKIEFQNSQVSMQNPQINGPMYEITGNDNVNLKAPNNG